MQRYQQLTNHLHTMGLLGVAFSGGVDSTLLAKAAHDALGKRAVAITINGPMQLRSELDAARSLSQQIGIRQIELQIDWSALPELHTNPADRCYLCKSNILLACRQQLDSTTIADEHWNLADGSNLDDLQTHRPGRRALQEQAVRSPLAELGFDKREIRSLSRQLGLPSWDKPAQSCLLTRFPHNTSLTVVDLQRVEACEEQLRTQGLGQVRVRCLGSTARVELGHQELAAVTANPLLEQSCIKLCTEAGFAEVSIDLNGYRSGSMD